MIESTLLPERIYGLSRSGGGRPARPGETIALRFSLRNEQVRTTPAARLRFNVPEGWTPLDPTDVEVPPLAAGTAHTSEVRVRADAGDASAGAFQAVVRTADLTL